MSGKMGAGNISRTTIVLKTFGSCFMLGHTHPSPRVPGIKKSSFPTCAVIQRYEVPPSLQSFLSTGDYWEMLLMCIFMHPVDDERAYNLFPQQQS